MTVKEMLHKMDSRELTQQMAFDQMQDKKWLTDFKRKQRFKDYIKENEIDG